MNMKRIVILLAISLTSLLATAHPQANDGLNFIPLGSTLTAVADINVLPRSLSVLFDSNGVRDLSSNITEVWCLLYAKETSNYDRKIENNTVYKIVSMERHMSTSTTVEMMDFQLNSSSLGMLRCFGTGSENAPITIGELKKALGKVFRLDIAPPITIR